MCHGLLSHTAWHREHTSSHTSHTQVHRHSADKAMQCHSPTRHYRISFTISGRLGMFEIANSCCSPHQRLSGSVSVRRRPQRVPAAEVCAQHTGLPYAAVLARCGCRWQWLLHHCCCNRIWRHRDCPCLSQQCPIARCKHDTGQWKQGPSGRRCSSGSSARRFRLSLCAVARLHERPILPSQRCANNQMHA